MSDVQESKEKKAPTTWYTIGIGALVGAFLGPQNFLHDRHAGDPLIRYFLPGQWGLTVVIVEIVFAIIGVMIGQSTVKSISRKWTWLWIGAIMGTWLLAPVVAIFWMFFIGGY